VREIKVNFPKKQEKHDVLATLWARTKIDDLMSKDYRSVENREEARKEVISQITGFFQFVGYLIRSDRRR